VQRYIALLGGLPVGRDAVRMPTLRSLFKELGFGSVETFLATGNVAFETAPVGNLPPLEAQISRHLQRKLGEAIEVFIRLPDELAEIAASEPLPAEDLRAPGNALFVVFLKRGLDERAQRRLRFNRTKADEFHAHGREIYWLRRTPMGAGSPPMLAETLGVPATVRSINTVKRLAAKYSTPRARRPPAVTR